MNVPFRDSVWVDPWNPGVQTHAGQRLAGLSGQSVVVVVGNYKFAALFTRNATTSACSEGFVTHVETMSPPYLRNAVKQL